MSEPASDTTTSAPRPAGDGPGSGKKRRRHPGGPAWFAPLFWLALCAAFVFLRFRSFRHTDFVLFHTRSGDVQGIASHKGQVLLAVSTLSLGRERALTIERDTEPAESFDKLYHLVYGSVEGRKEFLGFGFAATQKGDVPGDATHSAFAVPHWFLALLVGIPAMRGLWLLGRYYTRPGRGRCRNCGYDLRGTGGAVPGTRCPECGETVADEDDVVAASGARRRGRRTAVVLGAGLLSGAGALYALRLSRPAVPPMHPHYSPAQVQAGFARPIGNVEFDAVPLEQVLRRLADVAGARIDVDWGELESLDVHARLKVTARFTSDVALAAALHHIFHNAGRGRPELFVKGDGILLARYPPGPPRYLVRVYDVGQLLSGIPDEPLPPPPPVVSLRGRAVAGSSLNGPRSTRAEARANLVLMLQAHGPSRGRYVTTDDRVFLVVRASSTPDGIYEYGDRLVVVQTEVEQWRIGKSLRDARLTWDAQRRRAVAGQTAGIIPP